MNKPFKVVEQSDPERIQISYDGKADIHLIKTDQGFVIDVYNKEGENINTATIWDDDLYTERDWTDDLSEEEQPDECKE
jgi:hypothetical protein